ncbi:unnamed protein product [Adineta steineri]|uniref:Uncharacterized protein n=1 Tax=Adineta steineri TaxID=433720 RepID=A0A814U8F8_9BILA|nr:unnamed protein product [Adineta steineri]
MPRCSNLLLLYLFVLVTLSDLFLSGARGDTAEVKTADIVNDHLEKGKKLLATGQLSDALTHFHSAVEADPQNYLSYFRRATVYLAMGKSKAALPDLSKVIELKPDFVAARMQRGNVLLKQGDFDEAREDFQTVLRSDSSNGEAHTQLDTTIQMGQVFQEAESSYTHQDYARAIELLSTIIEVSL